MPEVLSRTVELVGDLFLDGFVAITALALVGGLCRGPWRGHECTQVEFLPLSDAAIARYVATGEPMDKAGAYAVQGAGGIRVHGHRRVPQHRFRTRGGHTDVRRFAWLGIDDRVADVWVKLGRVDLIAL